MEKGNHYLKAVLPEYAPPERVWEAMMIELEKLPVGDLPVYEPGEAVWESIEIRLEKESGRRRWAPWLRTAAAAILFCAALAKVFPEEDVSVSFSEEVLDEKLQISAVSEADHQYDQLMAVCVSQKELCRNPGFTRLAQEFEVLRKASAEIQRAAGAYNGDRVLVDEHTVLELKKAEVLSELAKFI